MDSPKVNTWYSLMHDKIIVPFLFCEKTIIANTYQYLFENYVIPQLLNLQPNTCFNKMDTLSEEIKHARSLR